MLGLPKGKVFFMPWTDIWSKEFSVEKIIAIDEDIVAVHHIGSTAVKRLSAKPILDITIEISQFDDEEMLANKLQSLGYAYAGTNILPDRHYLVKGEPRTHQIHMYQSGNKYLQEQLTFRDYLRTNSDVRKEYEQLKRQLAEANNTDKHKYTEEKTTFIQSILKEI